MAANMLSQAMNDGRVIIVALVTVAWVLRRVKVSVKLNINITGKR